MIKSSLGPQLDRAELFSEDQDGKRIGPIQPGHRRLHETRATPNLTHGVEEQQVISRAVVNLTDEEREVLRLQQDRVWRWKEFKVAPSKLDEAVKNGYAFIRTERNRALIGKQFPVSLTYEEIGERMGLSASQVHSRVKSANRKLRGTR